MRVTDYKSEEKIIIHFFIVGYKLYIVLIFENFENTHKKGIHSPAGSWHTKLLIEQKDMTFDHDICYSFSFSSSLFFRREEKRGKVITKVVVKKTCLSA